MVLGPLRTCLRTRLLPRPRAGFLLRPPEARTPDPRIWGRLLVSSLDTSAVPTRGFHGAEDMQWDVNIS